MKVPWKSLAAIGISAAVISGCFTTTEKRTNTNNERVPAQVPDQGQGFDVNDLSILFEPAAKPQWHAASSPH